MPKQVDHERRRRELAEAACRVVAREGVDGASLRLVAAEAGWSIGSMRHYFSTRDELLVFALRQVGAQIEERVVRLPEGGGALERLRAVIGELLPVDAVRRDEALVWLAFLARAAVDPALAPESEDVWRRLHRPFVWLVGAAVASGELPERLDVEREATRLQALVDGLVVHLVTAPGHVAPARALALVDDHLAALRTPLAGVGSRRAEPGSADA